MSVQKCIISKSLGNFTTLLNKVLQGLTNFHALGLYSYIASLPHGWVFHKEHLMRHGQIGRHKLDQLLKVLVDHNLIKLGQMRAPDGKFSYIEIMVLDGSDFKIKDLEKPSQTEKEPLSRKPLADNGITVNSSYKGNTTNEINNKTNISCASDEARSVDNSSFEKFWSIYPRKKAKALAEKKWKANKLDKIAEQVISHVEAMNMSEWKGKEVQFIPHPATYINQQRWNDAIEGTNNEKSSGVRTITKQAESVNNYFDYLRRHASSGLAN